MQEETNQLVLSFSGVQIQFKPRWSKKYSKNEDFIKRLFAHMDISDQTSLAYQDTRKAVDLALEKGFFGLSFTGYAFGALLAEQSVYFFDSKTQ